MKERPILFSAPMVRAILAGNKTVTRRVAGIGLLNEDPGRYRYLGIAPGPGAPHFAFHDEVSGAQTLVNCRYGQPGDRLWVKETHRPVVAHSCAMDACDCADVNVEYQADGEIRYFSDYAINEASPDWCLPKAAQRGNFVPSIHMPRWASRITLEITGVRVERLQAISRQEAAAEGVCMDLDGPLPPWLRRDRWPEENFAALWESINGAGSWAANPWVWVVEFKRIAQGEPA